MTYQIKDTVGPTVYPASYKFGQQSCATLEYDATAPRSTSCSRSSARTKTYPILPKFAKADQDGGHVRAGAAGAHVLSVR